eukprot:g27105.t2
MNRRAFPGLRPLGLLAPVPKGQQEPVKAGPVPPGVVTAGSGEAEHNRGWSRTPHMLALTRSINSLNLEPAHMTQDLPGGPSQMIDGEPPNAERSDTPESPMMPVFQPKEPGEMSDQMQNEQPQQRMILNAAAAASTAAMAEVQQQLEKRRQAAGGNSEGKVKEGPLGA